MPTIKDVAAKANVSVATVSRVLNESGYADPDTRARVLKAAAELNYQRNVNWSRLKSKSSHTILFLLGNRSHLNAFFVRLLESCERTLRGRGYDLIFARHEYSSEARTSELPLPRMLEQSGAIDGVLLAGVHHPNFIQILKQRQLPYAVMGNNFRGSAAAKARHCVSFDDRTAMEDATNYLIRMRHRRIAYIGNVHLSWFQARYEGYLAAMQASGLPPLSVGDNWQISNIDYGKLATAQLLRGSNHPTALIAGNDEIAAGAWKELAQRKIAIPTEISLLGMGDRAEFSILEPALTSISVFEEQLGERLTLMLLDQIRDPKLSPASETYPCKLIERASCAPIHEVRTLQAVQRKYHDV